MRTQNSNGKIVDFYYNDITKLLLGVLLPIIPTLAVKWFTYHLNKRDAQKQAAEVNLLDIQQVNFDKLRIIKYADDLEVVIKKICQRFHEGEEISKYDIDTLEMEMAQRPKVSKDE